MLAHDSINFILIRSIILLKMISFINEIAAKSNSLYLVIYILACLKLMTYNITLNSFGRKIKLLHDIYEFNTNIDSVINIELLEKY